MCEEIELSDQGPFSTDNEVDERFDGTVIPRREGNDKVLAYALRLRKVLERFFFEVRALVGYRDVGSRKISAPTCKNFSGLLSIGRGCGFEPKLETQVVLRDEKVLAVNLTSTEEEVFKVDNIVRLLCVERRR